LILTNLNNLNSFFEKAFCISLLHSLSLCNFLLEVTVLSGHQFFFIFSIEMKIFDHTNTLEIQTLKVTVTFLAKTRLYRN